MRKNLINLKKVLKDRQINKNRKLNKKAIPVFDDCDFLPAWRFFKILYAETPDLRYLLDYPGKKLPEYFESLLEPVWDKVLSQFDKLNGNQLFKNSFLDFYSDLIEKNELLIMKACLNKLLTCIDYTALLISGEFNKNQAEAINSRIESIYKYCSKELQNVGVIIPKEFSTDSIQIVKRKIAQVTTRLSIQALQEEGPSKSEQPNFIKSVVQLSNILGRSLDKDKITVTEWVYADKDAKEIVKAKKELHGTSH